MTTIESNTWGIRGSAYREILCDIRYSDVQKLCVRIAYVTQSGYIQSHVLFSIFVNRNSSCSEISRTVYRSLNVPLHNISAHF